MYYEIERIDKICSEISKHVYKEKINIDNYKYVEGNYKNIEAIKSVDDEKWCDFKAGNEWGGMDCHGWFKCHVEVPEKLKGKTIALNFITSEEEWDNVINPQFMLYVNGQLLQGLDVNHTETILTHDAISGTRYSIDLHAYSGRMSDKKATLRGSLVEIDMEARKLYYNLQVPNDVCRELESNDNNRINMLSVLNEAINIIDLRIPYSKEYDESIKKANKFLEENFYGKLCGHEEITATCVGHTHIDVAWLWTVLQTREKVARSFSTVLKLMEEYPEYKFMSSQPQLYEFLKEDFPDLYYKIKEKVKAGVWEPEGAMWLEADCNVTSGESLIRQIMHGKKFFKDEFNVDSKILWLPDVFGYSAALPQIMKKSGIEYFMTTKISWNQFNMMPNDTFMWEGIDGTEVLTHFITTPGPKQDKNKFFTTYTGQIQADTVMGAWRRYQNKDLNKDVLIAFGWGDGGGGATIKMLENARRLAKGIPGAPKITMGKSLEYFKRLEERTKDNKKLPKWVGELYLEYHRGTYTSMARNKRDNRRCENLYIAAEKVSSLSMLQGKNYPHELINKSWKNILLNQFHDILPGSSIKEVYEVTAKEYNSLLKNAEYILNDNINYISSKVNIKNRSVIVFNTLGFERNDIAKFKVAEEIKNIALVDEEGRIIPCQRTEKDNAIFFAENIPANGYKVFRVIEANNPANNGLIINKEKAENKFVKLRFNNKGEIISLIDKESEREILKSGAVGNEFQAFEDKPMYFDNWDIDIYYKEKMWKIDEVESIQVLENGPVRGTIKIEKKFLNSKITQYIHLYSEIKRVDFETEIDWKEHDIVVKAAFPVEINAKEATYEIQYGNVTRPTHENTSWEAAQFEVCGHKWADLSEGDYGVSILNDCKYGYDIKQGVMRLTLLKCGTNPNPDADKEKHSFVYSIYPHLGTWREANTVYMAYNLNTPLFTKIEDSHSGILPCKISLANVDKKNVMIEVIKKAEESDDLIIRLYEYENKRTNVTLSFSRELEYIFECGLMENNLKKMSSEGNNIKFTIKPYEIKTFKFRFKTN